MDIVGVVIVIFTSLLFCIILYRLIIIDDNINELQTYMDIMNARIDDIKATIDSYKAEIGKLDDEVGNLQSYYEDKDETKGNK